MKVISGMRPVYKMTEVGEIPEDWNLQYLNELVTFLDGQRRPIKSSEREKMKGIFPYYGASSIVDYVNGYLFDEELILLGEDGDNILSRNLPLAFRVSGKIWVNNYAHVLRPNETVSIGFFTEYLESVNYEQLNSGTAQPKLNKKSCNSIKIPIPPTKAEQEAIAESLGGADAWIESLESLIAKKRLIKQGTMQELLTPPVAGQARKTRLPGFEGEWVERRLGDLGDSLIGLTYSPSEVCDSGVLVLRSSNVQQGALCFDDTVFVDREINGRIMVRPGDILICVRNGSRELIGKCAKIDERAKRMTFGAFMSVFRTEFHSFVHHQFQSDVIKRQIHDHLGATINQITNASLNSFQIPFPLDLDEQTAIAEILSVIDTEIEALGTQLQKARRIKEGMMAELLTGKTRLVEVQKIS